MNGYPIPHGSPRTSDTHRQYSNAGIQSIEWYHTGQARTFEVGGVRITTRLVSRKGRRARIVITAPAGASFLDVQT